MFKYKVFRNIFFRNVIILNTWFYSIMWSRCFYKKSLWNKVKEKNKFVNKESNFEMLITKKEIIFKIILLVLLILVLIYLIDNSDIFIQTAYADDIVNQEYNKKRYKWKEHEWVIKYTSQPRGWVFIILDLTIFGCLWAIIYYIGKQNSGQW